MVDVFKNSFKHSVRNRLLDIEQIKTLAKEVEAIVNTRPLTYVTDDLDYYPSRPIDFLRPYANLQDHILKKLMTNGLQSPPQTTEYLTSLREHYKTEHKTPRSYEDGCPQLGDYALIHDPVLNRGQWKMGKIVGSQDDFRRSVDIQLPSKKIITRPNNLVYKLEISQDTTPAQRPEPPQPPIAGSSHHPMMTRSKARLISSSTLLYKQTLLYATTSTSKGIAIVRCEYIRKEVMCWFPIHCPMGHIRFEQSTLHTSSTLCGKTCKCPQWAP
ncbi:hypothetical protein ANCCAN_19885 [Ancylostoma caninum]|uniref:Uncharacterized protein n=1 Tax=Ancylostoma caninum TaxID=29170 RepID=A0A368FU00_ANCCA|nr:hypothetical protein ANCCAN_19885 [Ancylostoma caninum]